MNNTLSHDSHSEEHQPRKASRKWLTVLKWTAGSILGLLLLVCALIGGVVYILTPEKLTPLVEKYASEYLLADVKIKQVKLTYWETFPTLKLEVDSLNLRSRSLNGVTDSIKSHLPADADELLSLKKFSGSVNIVKLLANKIELSDISIDNPRINLVIVNDSVNNFNIVPPSEETDTTATKIPDITFNRFNITGALNVRYVNLADTTDVKASILPTHLVGKNAPVYAFKTGGDTKIKLGSLVLPENINFSFDTRIDWKQSAPSSLALKQCSVGIGPINALINTSLIFGEKDIAVNSFSLKLSPVNISELIKWVPSVYTEQIKALKTDMTVSGSLSLTEPYITSQKALPSCDISINIPECKVSFEELNLKRLSLEADAHFNGKDMDRSTVNIKKLVAVGDGIGCKIDGAVTDVISDPHFKGLFKGGINFANLPRSITKLLPVNLSGLLLADAKFDIRQSYLSQLNFHKISLDGNATLTNFRLKQRGSSTDLYLRKAKLLLGTQSSRTNQNGVRIDSLLTAIVDIDTLSCYYDGITMTGSTLHVAAGSKNSSVEAKGGGIIPVGMKIEAKQLRYLNPVDSATILVRDPFMAVVIKRYENSKQRPEVTAEIKSKSVRYKSIESRITLREPVVNLKLHLNNRPRMGAKMAATYDSILALHPKLRPDSIYALARQARMARRRVKGVQSTPNDSTQTLDLRADKETQTLLKWWDFSGKVTARRGRIITPYFPLKNVLRNVDIAFDMDSTVITNTTFKAGRSSLLINGTISNYTNALTRKNAAMNIRFKLDGDTIDINQLSDAAFLGAAYAEKISESAGALAAAQIDDDDAAEKALAKSMSDSVRGPLLMPLNLDAMLGISSKTALYDGLVMKDLVGVARLHEGALSVSELGASTEAGTVNLNALYAAPSVNQMKLGLGMVLRNFYIERFTKLFPTLQTVMPALNTLSGRINAEMAATTDIRPNMDLNIESLSALLTVKGDDLVVIDPDTYKLVSKWLMFKNKNRNMIDSISAQVAIDGGQLEIYPFIFNFDRYKLGVMGHNDLAMNLNYHVSVLKSPIPFKFGINISGSPEKMKVRLGRAKIKSDMTAERINLVTSSRINLIKEMDKAFADGMKRAKLHKLEAMKQAAKLKGSQSVNTSESLTPSDSLELIRQSSLPIEP